MLNKVILQGRLTKDVELRRSSSGVAVGMVLIAVQRSFKNKEGGYDTDFFDVTFWGKTAENVAEFFHKGDAILIEGSIRQNRFTDKNGNKRTTYGIVAEKFRFNAGAQRVEPEDDLDDEELPF